MCRACARIREARARAGLPTVRANQLEMGVCAGGGHPLTPENHRVYRYPREGLPDRVMVACLECGAAKREARRAAAREMSG